MKPKFATIVAWQQAELLMQPTFIRVIDNLRKQLEQSTWQGTYRDAPVWADNTPETVKATVIQLQEQLKTAMPEQAEDIQQALSKLPIPAPGYELCLKQDDRQFNVDLWELCYQVCFLPHADDQPVEVDPSLLDETGEVDWNQLDDKTKALVEQIFENLPRD